jgi:hypothetical protein
MKKITMLLGSIRPKAETVHTAMKPAGPVRPALHSSLAPRTARVESAGTAAL